MFADDRCVTSDRVRGVPLILKRRELSLEDVSTNVSAEDHVVGIVSVAVAVSSLVHQVARRDNLIVL